MRHVGCLSQTLVNLEPHTLAGEHRLNFFGRATEPSVKNFQLVARSDRQEACLCYGGHASWSQAEPRVVMLFGKCRDDSFSLDYRHPITGAVRRCVHRDMRQG